jgi:hypothetical protein
MTRLAGLGALILTAPGAALAHHGFGSFDVLRDIEISGRITGVELVNPHAWLYLDVTEAGGRVRPVRCELRDAAALKRAGWSEALFVRGEPITIEGSPDRLDPDACYVKTLIFADGRRLERHGQVEAR